MVIRNTDTSISAIYMFTMASSGSRLGSTSNSKSVAPPAPDGPAAPIAPGGIPRSSARIGEEMITSERRCAPGGTDRRCLKCISHEARPTKKVDTTYELSALDTFSTNALSTLDSPSSIPSPKTTTSTATLFFFNFLASFTISRSSAAVPSRGDPTNTIILCRKFLFSRCFKANCAILIAVGISLYPPIFSDAV